MATCSNVKYGTARHKPKQKPSSTHHREPEPSLLSAAGGPVSFHKLVPCPKYLEKKQTNRKKTCFFFSYTMRTAVGATL